MKKAKKLFIGVMVLSLLLSLFSTGSAFASEKFTVHAKVPATWSTKNYSAVLLEEPVLLWLRNSLLLAVSTVVVSLTFAIPAAYAFSRFRFPGKKTILYMLLILNAFPSILSMLAIYKLFFSAASILISLPILIIFFKFQKYMVSGLTVGGVKG